MRIVKIFHFSLLLFFQEKKRYPPYLADIGIGVQVSHLMEILEKSLGNATFAVGLPAKNKAPMIPIFSGFGGKK